MDIQDNSVVTDVDTEILDGEITQISNDFSETYYFDGEQEEELEMLVAKAMKLGELYERKKWQAAKAQAVPDLGELQERIAGHQYYHDERGHMIVDMDDVVKEISGFDSWKAQAVPEGFGDIQSWIAVNSFSALDASMDDFPVVDANELTKYIDSLIEAQGQK